MGLYYGFVHYKKLHAKFLKSIDNYQGALILHKTTIDTLNKEKNKLLDRQQYLTSELVQIHTHANHLGNTMGLVNAEFNELKRQYETTLHDYAVMRSMHAMAVQENDELKKGLGAMQSMIDQTGILPKNLKTWDERMQEMKNKYKK